MHEREHSVDSIRESSQIFGPLEKLLVANRGVSLNTRNLKFNFFSIILIYIFFKNLIGLIGNSYSSFSNGS
jgi:hypothetical protein